MSQRAFAKLLGVSYTTMQLWEKGESIPDVVNMANIADRAGYTMEELVTYSHTESEITVWASRRLLVSLSPSETLRERTLTVRVRVACALRSASPKEKLY
ncbi:MAG: helix-turn-helix transcriptional regulator [Nostocaceae cyanobacterium]|nr:helix-turn-helix transcriptional regulator [Nostocaceae cyanobacterium]